MSNRILEGKRERITRADASTKHKSAVVDRVGNAATLTRAVQQLIRSHKPRRVLIVPDESLNAARKLIHEIRGTEQSGIWRTPIVSMSLYPARFHQAKEYSPYAALSNT